ncbi:hypothetical protein [Actinokineospora sp. UTMC 2448]|uniref:hypothetical protein n=1 Tax=Actinokineospora sp. UTMC 2448 TaxID=2268449 RepID=UPI0021645D1F|nr:hypothetical protein [Actinokineospora sp. UTMC 2448]UVS81519.1 hypothetical protein Actkin_05277 [Actinokineospora sp. UTMC 2448]
MTDRIRSEQQESLDPAPSPRREDRTGPSPQFTDPDGGGAPSDTEATEIAEDAGSEESAGPEDQAMRIEEDPDASGRTGDASSGYLDDGQASSS